MEILIIQIIYEVPDVQKVDRFVSFRMDGWVEGEGE